MKTILCLLLLAVAAQAKLTSQERRKAIPLHVNPPMRSFPVSRKGGLKITGGQEAAPQQFPHQVALYVTLSQGLAFCGGSLISQNYVLTAAHCLDGASQAEVILGAQNVSDASEETQVDLVSTDLTVHADYGSVLIRNDIAVLKLPQPVEFTDAIQPIALPSRSQVGETFVGETSTVSGWGLSSDSATTISDVLRYVENPIITNTECAETYSALILTASKICTSGADGKSTCSGDSGGPLTVPGADGSPVQIGIVSFGVSLGCEQGYPPAFTRVTSYLDWIEQHTDVTIAE